MDDLPTIHRRSGFTKQYSAWLKHALFGSHSVSSEDISELFPSRIDSGMEMEVVPRENILSSSYQFENTYFVKVITERHLKLHRLLTRWRNTVFKVGKIGAPFTSFNSPLDMAEYEYNASEIINEKTGAVAEPHAIDSVESNDSTGVILYDFVNNAGQIDQTERTLKQFEHIIVSLREIHEAGYIHTSIADHIIRQIPDGEPHIIGCTGDVKSGENHVLTGVGFDIASLLVRYSPVIGTLPALNVVEEHYTDLELIAAYEAVKVTPVLVPGTSPWVIRQVQSSIDEFVEGRSIDDFINKTRSEDGSTGSSLLEETQEDGSSNESENESENDDDNIPLGEYDDATPINYD